MAKIRVYELAKELGLDNKEILAKMRGLKIAVKSHMSVLTDEDVEKIRASMTDPAAVVSSAGGVEEKRVARGVIRRRTVAAPKEEAEPEKEQPKVDLGSLKQGAKRVRRETEEHAAKPTPELAEIPKEWEQEEEEAPAGRKKKPARAKKAAGKKEPAAGERAEEPRPAEAGAPPAPAGEPAPETPPRAAPEAAAPAPAEAPAREGKAEKKAPAGPRKIYIKPSLRRTARAVEGEPLPIPGRPAPAKPAAPAAEAAAEGAKKKKKKKKGRQAEEEAPIADRFEEAPKKKLRRKIAFKQQRGTEGMEVADVEQMYQPSRKKVTGKKKVQKKTVITTPKAAKRIIRMAESISVADLARQLETKEREILRALEKEGGARNQALDADTAGIIAGNYNYEIVQEVFDEDKVIGASVPSTPENLRPRPPVVTVMGHVDHGKTSLLDTIRKTRVTEEEAGAITQHIGASMIELSSGRITFIDTPGHEAFTAMRARGAKVTDLVILVVAADDGIMPQTIEAANHAKAAGVPIIVAINKVDLPAAKPNVVKQRLSEIGIAVEGWGGETLAIECSAKTGQGVPDLLEAILLQSELLELKADPLRPGKGLVIESRLDKGKGPVATVVVQEGTLKRGSVILCGTIYGRIRAMLDDRGNPVSEAGPSVPVEIMGLSSVPEPGEQIVALDDERKAKLVAEHRIAKLKGEKALTAAPAKVSLEDLMARLREGEVQQLNLILKTDTQGSAEAIRAAAEKLSRDEVKVAALHVGVGNITENDVLLASASNAVIMGFQVKVEGTAKKIAENEGVQIRTYDIIYNLLDDVQASLTGMLKPVFEEIILGKAEVRKVFRVSKVGTVAGSYVTDGLVRRGASVRVIRAGETVFTGRIKSLKRVTEDVREVAQGLECGISIENFSKVEEGDIVEAYEVSEQSPI
jgi:translation initiation factor IF-2